MMNPTKQPQPMTAEQLPASVYATEPWQGVGHTYKFLPTIEVVRALGDNGIHPYLAKATKTRIDGKRGYTKHMLRFRAENAVAMPGEVFPEIVLTNAHDTASSFRIDLGLFRLVCMNGLVTSYGMASRYRVRHVGSTVEDVLENVRLAMGEFPRLGDTVLNMQAKLLNEQARQSFAHAASLLRWDSDKAPFEASLLLITRRPEDEEPTLWNVYNTVQENLLTGQRIRTFGPSFRGYRTRTQTTREVQSIDKSMDLNNGLWKLANEYAELATV